MALVVVRPKARREINSFLAHYIETAGIEVAKRFRKAATETFAELAATPLMGTPGQGAQTRIPWSEDVARSEVRCIPHFLLERVIHASQDYQRMLRGRKTIIWTFV